MNRIGLDRSPMRRSNRPGLCFLWLSRSHKISVCLDRIFPFKDKDD